MNRYPKSYNNQHQWGVIAQCKNPYREFAYCPLCNQYKEAGSREHTLMSRRFFTALSISLRDTNPMFEPDSDRLLSY